MAMDEKDMTVLPAEATDKVSDEFKSKMISDEELENVSGGYGIASKTDAIFNLMR